MKPGKAIAAALLACAIAPAQAAASTVQVTPSGELRFDGAPGEVNGVELRYQRAAIAPSGAVGDRLVVADAVPVEPVGAACERLDPLTVSCGALPVSSIAIFLGDGDDVLSISSDGDAGVPGHYRTLAAGGPGSDVMRGGSGNDRLYGDDGRDVIAGWLGDDFVSGGRGTDAVIGNTGDDTLRGGPGTDVIFALKGHDRLFGGAGRDILAAKDGQRDPRINCAGGTAIVDRKDPRPRRCRKVFGAKKRRR